MFDPVGGALGLTDDEAKAKGSEFLFDELRARVKDGTVAFNFNLVLAEPADKLDSATLPLPAGRKKVTLGVLKVTSVSADGTGPCVTVNYNPMIMPKGCRGVSRSNARGPRRAVRRLAGASAD